MAEFNFAPFLIFLLLGSCMPISDSGKASDSNQKRMQVSNDFDFQGHRGCRGLLPENSIEGFLYALDLGVTTLEMDVVITADKKVILSHEPFFSHLICRDPSGNPISETSEKEHRIFQMTFAETQNYDCGSSDHPWFPDQKNIPSTKPLLLSVIDTAELHATSKGRPLPYYNIETKSTPEGDHTMHPGPEEFSQLLLDVVFEKGIQNRTIIQSFDIRTLQYIHEKYPDIKLAILVENQAGAEKNLESLGFVPDVYSPEHVLVDKDLVEFCRVQKMKLIPWTVNDKAEMKALIVLGVDGIISDYPDRFIDFLPAGNR